MLTHHLQDPNCNAAELLKSGAVSFNAFGKFTKFDPNDASFNSDQRNNIIQSNKRIEEL
jgi:hypothetical protein